VIRLISIGSNDNVIDSVFVQSDRIVVITIRPVTRRNDDTLVLRSSLVQHLNQQDTAGSSQGREEREREC
jgi:hypothetical protein